MKTEIMNDQLIADAMADFEKSNLSKQEFCELYEISEATFQQWKSKTESLRKSHGIFVPLGSNAVPLSPAEGSYAELVFPSGEILKLGGRIDPVLIRALIY